MTAQEQDKKIIEAHHFNCRQRAVVELKICRMIIQDAHAAGYVLAVDDFEEVSGIMDERDLIDLLFNLDDAYLFFYRPTDTTEAGRKGWVRFVFGNDGYDVVNDYTTNLEKTVLKRANKIAEDGYIS